jgi:hypothetical protein
MKALFKPIFGNQIEKDGVRDGMKTGSPLAVCLIYALGLGLVSEAFSTKACGSVVAPSVANFDDITMGSSSTGTAFTAYDGFNWTTSAGTTSGFTVYNATKNAGGFNGTNLGITSGCQAAYNTGGLDTAVTLASNASTFALSSMELSCANSSTPFSLKVVGYDLTTSGAYQQVVTSTFALTSCATLESFNTTNWTGLSKVVFEAVDSNGNLLTSFGTATTFRVDDFSYTTQAVQAVPEPSSWAGLAAAVGAALGIGVSLRKFKGSEQAEESGKAV